MKRAIATAMTTVTLLCILVVVFFVRLEFQRSSIESEAFHGLGALRCEVYSQPIAFTTHSRHVILCGENSELGDDSTKALSSLERLTRSDTVDLIISTERVTDRSIEALSSLRTLDLLDARESGISQNGLKALAENLPHCLVLVRD